MNTMHIIKNSLNLLKKYLVTFFKHLSTKLFSFFAKVNFSVFIKHPMVTAIVGAIVGAILGSLLTIWLNPSCIETPETCWKIQNHEVYYHYNDYYSDPLFDRWHGYHLMVNECSLMPKTLAEFLKQISNNKGDIRKYIEILSSDENSIKKWNALSIFQEAYWQLIKQRKLQIESNGGKYIKFQLSNIKNNIIYKLNEKYLETPTAKIIIDTCLVKIDQFIAGNNDTLLKKIKYSINTVLPEYIRFSDIYNAVNFQYHISIKLTEFKLKNVTIPQIKFYYYENENLLNTYSLLIPLVRNRNTHRGSYFQNSFRAFIGKLLRENILPIN